jgi:tetratricopeptide (TPR) repeat protein
LVFPVTSSIKDKTTKLPKCSPEDSKKPVVKFEYFITLVSFAARSHSVSTMKVALLTVFSAALINAQAPSSEWLPLNHEGLRLSKIPDYAAAEQAFRSALAEAERFGEQDSRFAETLSNLAVIRREQGDLDQAEKLIRRAVELREKYAGADSRELAWALNNLGAILHAAGRDAEADPVLRRALLIAETAGDDKLIGPILNGLGLSLMDQGEAARAEPVLRRALAIFEKSSGSDSLEVGRAANNLGMLYCLNREYAKAETELRRALQLYEKHVDPEHPFLAVTLNNLFTILADEKRFDEGEPYLRRALAICEKTCEGTARLASMHAGLATLEASRGNYQAAAKLLEGAIEVQERMLGPNHPQLAMSLASYSEVLRHLHQKAEAKRAANRANAILKTFR